ncbi:hypothetical protein D1AOALGA4SA_5327 [Olavius algarvensis Delta 1 endosymbiont]|nr:hypothetical protein D1AOALGA4SA_5327 [Olavius algarvensis Delta 1 endosymbiont]
MTCERFYQIPNTKHQTHDEFDFLRIHQIWNSISIPISNPHSAIRNPQYFSLQYSITPALHYSGIESFKPINSINESTYSTILASFHQQLIEWTHKRKNSHYISMIR